MTIVNMAVSKPLYHFVLFHYPEGSIPLYSTWQHIIRATKTSPNNSYDKTDISGHLYPSDRVRSNFPLPRPCQGGHEVLVDPRPSPSPLTPPYPPPTTALSEESQQTTYCVRPGKHCFDNLGLSTNEYQFHLSMKNKFRFMSVLSAVGWAAAVVGWIADVWEKER